MSMGISDIFMDNDLRNLVKSLKGVKDTMLSRGTDCRICGQYFKDENMVQIPDGYGGKTWACRKCARKYGFRG